jgi:hypothetical protein
MDSSKHGQSKSEFVDDGGMSHSSEKEHKDVRDNFFKVRNVFEILIREASFLIDEKAFQ